MSRMPADVAPGTEHKTNIYGSFCVIEYRSANEIEVKFKNTETKRIVAAKEIRSGSVKDPMAKTVCGVGCFGIGEYRAKINKKPQPAYLCWAGMIVRCYQSHLNPKNKTYFDCYVCDEWLNFQNFARWYYDNYPKDGKKYCIDKDIKIKGNRIYSPDSCIFVTNEDNIVAAHAHSYSFLSPDGVVFSGENIAELSRNHDLVPSCMYRMVSGERKSQRGWKLA